MEENTMEKRDLVEESKKAKKAEKSDTVSVGCSIAMGVKFIMNNGEVVELKGVPQSHIVSADKIGTPLPAGKYGVTTIKRSQWEEILARYGNCDFIKKELIFAENTAEEVENKGKAYKAKGKRNGFEQAKKEVGNSKAKSLDD